MFAISNSEYKVRPRGIRNWRDFDLVRLEISVGQAYHEGEKLSAILQWAQENFSHVHLILGDTTQRYNLMMNGMDHARALAYAERLGRDWLHRNRNRLAIIPNIYIHRWDDWRRSQEFISTFMKVKMLYEKNIDFAAAIKAEISDSFARRMRRNECTEADRDRHAILSCQYLLEETAVFALAFRDLPGVSAYPGSFGEMWKMFIDANIPGAPIGLNNAYSMRLSFEPRTIETKIAA